MDTKMERLSGFRPRGWGIEANPETIIKIGLGGSESPPRPGIN